MLVMALNVCRSIKGWTFSCHCLLGNFIKQGSLISGCQFGFQLVIIDVLRDFFVGQGAESLSEEVLILVRGSEEVWYFQEGRYFLTWKDDFFLASPQLLLFCTCMVHSFSLSCLGGATILLSGLARPSVPDLILPSIRKGRRGVLGISWELCQILLLFIDLSCISG